MIQLNFVNVFRLKNTSNIFVFVKIISFFKGIQVKFHFCRVMYVCYIYYLVVNIFLLQLFIRHKEYGK